MPLRKFFLAGVCSAALQSCHVTCRRRLLIIFLIGLVAVVDIAVVVVVVVVTNVVTEAMHNHTLAFAGEVRFDGCSGTGVSMFAVCLLYAPRSRPDERAFLLLISEGNGK